MSEWSIIIKVVLFDIDGTLVRCDGAGKAALMQSCLEIFGTIGSMKRIDFQGKTDPLILKESLSTMGFDDGIIAKNIDSLKEKYFNYLAGYMEIKKGTVLPGIEILLTRLSRDDRVLLGLLTGNFRISANIKLGHFDLSKYFTFGVFGDDASIRNEMPYIARDIVQEKFFEPVSFKDMIIIGDTVYDIACAKEVQAKSISVGTGWASKDALLACAPDYFFDNLSDTEEVIKAIFHR